MQNTPGLICSGHTQGHELQGISLVKIYVS